MKTTGTGAFKALSPSKRVRRSEAASIITERAPEGSPLWPYVARDLLRLARLEVELTPELVGRMLDSAEKAHARDQEIATLNSEAFVSRRTTAGRCDYPGIAKVAGNVVYYMRIGNRVKIGTSGNLVGRLEAINPEQLMAVERGDYRVEGERHRQFARLRVHGEWFRLEGELVDHIEAVRAQGLPR